MRVIKIGNIVDWNEEHKILKESNPEPEIPHPVNEAKRVFPDDESLQNAWLQGWDYCRKYVHTNYNIKI